MSSSLSTRQRSTLVSSLVLTGQASVVAGIFLGWSMAAVLSAGVAGLVTAILIAVEGSARSRRPQCQPEQTR